MNNTIYVLSDQYAELEPVESPPETLAELIAVAKPKPTQFILCDNLDAEERLGFHACLALGDKHPEDAATYTEALARGAKIFLATMTQYDELSGANSAINAAVGEYLRQTLN